MEFVICGDFNINFHKQSIFNKQITLPFQSYKGFRQIIFQLEYVRFTVLHLIMYLWIVVELTHIMYCL